MSKRKFCERMSILCKKKPPRFLAAHRDVKLADQQTKYCSPQYPLHIRGSRGRITNYRLTSISHDSSQLFGTMSKTMGG